ncbi:MAG: hypothetical protein Q9222_002517 [Ikaeria aurantiellina]
MSATILERLQPQQMAVRVEDLDMRTSAAIRNSFAVSADRRPQNRPPEIKQNPHNLKTLYELDHSLRASPKLTLATQPQRSLLTLKLLQSLHDSISSKFQNSSIFPPDSNADLFRDVFAANVLRLFSATGVSLKAAGNMSFPRVQWKIDGLLDEVDRMKVNLEATEMELDREKTAASMFHQSLLTTKTELTSVQKAMNRDAFILILIDGDCMNFLDDLFQKLELGGEEAAERLRRYTTDYMKNEVPDSQLGLDIVVRVYTNMRGLGKTLVDNKILETTEDLGRFVCGFNKKFSLFDFVDAGNGKECSDAKLKKNFEMHINNAHCKHVIFGGSADNGYARLLSPHTGDNSTSKKITMLQGPPFASELAPIAKQLKQCSFPKVFRGTKIPARKVSFSTTPPRSMSPGVTSYASTAATARFEDASTPLSPKVIAQPAGKVAQNSKGQRVDRPIKVSQTTIQSIKGRRWCNSHHLLGYCGFENCSYEHNAQLTDAQKNALRTLTRQLPCSIGLDCDDPDCYFGHRCPGNPCTWGSACKFPLEMHHVDTKIVN